MQQNDRETTSAKEDTPVQKQRLLVNQMNQYLCRLGYKFVTQKIWTLRKPCSLNAEQMDNTTPYISRTG